MVKQRQISPAFVAEIIREMKGKIHNICCNPHSIKSPLLPFLFSLPQPHPKDLKLVFGFECLYFKYP